MSRLHVASVYELQSPITVMEDSSRSSSWMSFGPRRLLLQQHTATYNCTAGRSHVAKIGESTLPFFFPPSLPSSSLPLYLPLFSFPSSPFVPPCLNSSPSLLSLSRGPHPMKPAIGSLGNAVSSPGGSWQSPAAKPFRLDTEIDRVIDSDRSARQFLANSIDFVDLS